MMQSSDTQGQSAAQICKRSKEEIALKPLFSRNDKLAFLSALLFSAGSLLIHGESISAAVSTQNDVLAKTVRTLAESLGKCVCSVTKKGKQSYIEIQNATPLLFACHVLQIKDGVLDVCERIDETLVNEQSAAVAYIRGAYLGAGSLSADKYHLEFSFSRQSIAEDFASLLHRFEVGAKLSARKDRTVVYSKDSEAISDVLALMGAAKAVLAFNSVLAERQMAVHLNRQQNCDLHNIDKQVDASLRQCTFMQELDIESLSPALQRTVQARLANPDATYEQLAQILGISKSGLKNRLRRLQEIYDSRK